MPYIFFAVYISAWGIPHYSTFFAAYKFLYSYIYIYIYIYVVGWERVNNSK